MQIDKQATVSALTALGLAAVLVLGFGVDLFGWMYAQPESAQDMREVSTSSAVVTRVVDGDTLNVEVGTSSQAVRLIGIDAPEIEWPDDENNLSGPEEECFGFAARDFLKSKFATSSEVILAGDPNQPERDQYDRRLAYVYTEGELINEELIRQGYARELTVGGGYVLQEDFRTAEEAARDEARGLWEACPTAGK